jgi:hypothetical protein
MGLLRKVTLTYGTEFQTVICSGTTLPFLSACNGIP